MATVKAQADTIGVSPESIMRSKAFRHGVNDVRNGKRPRFDAAWGNDECEWEYEWGRQFGVLAPRHLQVVLEGQLNPEAVEFFSLMHGGDICS